MAEYSLADVKRLRDLTAAGMMDCKKALEESDGDFDKAIELLRIKGAKDVGKRSERVAGAGVVAAKLDGTSSGVIIELNCETDFVAKGDRFVALADQIAEIASTAKPADAAALLAADAGDGKTVADLIADLSAIVGEKMELRHAASFDGGYNAVYLHKTDPALPPTVGVMVQLDADNAEVAKDVAHHAAAMAPKYLTRDDVPAEVVAKEREIAEETAKEEGKPAAALPKIVEGRVNGFFKDFCLVEQAFVKDNKKTVGAYAKDNGVTITRFVRFKVGEA